MGYVSFREGKPSVGVFAAPEFDRISKHQKKGKNEAIMAALPETSTKPWKSGPAFSDGFSHLGKVRVI